MVIKDMTMRILESIGRNCYNAKPMKAKLISWNRSLPELSQLSGVAAILRFPMDDPEGEEEENNDEEEEEDDDDDDDGGNKNKIANNGENGYSDDEDLTKWSHHWRRRSHGVSRALWWLFNFFWHA